MWWWWGGSGTGVENALCSVYGWMPSQHHTAQQHSAQWGGTSRSPPSLPSDSRQTADRQVGAGSSPARGANPPGAAVAPRRDHCHNPTPT